MKNLLSYIFEKHENGYYCSFYVLNDYIKGNNIIIEDKKIDISKKEVFSYFPEKSSVVRGTGFTKYVRENTDLTFNIDDVTEENKEKLFKLLFNIKKDREVNSIEFYSNGSDFKDPNEVYEKTQFELRQLYFKYFKEIIKYLK
jgi:hypothetical protein